MYAIVRTGGKQYRVEAGDVLRIEKINKETGAEVELNEVLAIGGDKTYVGEPLVKDAKVTVVITKQAKAPKVIVFKKKRRQGYRKMQGHRQLYTEIFIKRIQGPAGEVSEAEQKKKSAAEKPEAKKVAKKAAKKKAKKPAAKKTAKKKAAKKKAAAKKTGGKKKTTKKAAAKKKTKKKS